jgi:sulfonate transport system substrate-binding protein
VSVFLLLGIGVFPVSANGKKDAPPPKLTKIRLGDLTTTSFIFKVAQEKGFFKEEFDKDGITVELNVFASGPPIIESFAAGELDFGTIGGQPVVQGFANEIPFKVIASSNYTDTAFKLVAGPKSGIGSIKDIVGKKISVGFGTNSHQVLINILQNAGIAEDKVELVNLSGTNEIAAALLSGALDASLSGEPGTSRLLNAGCHVVEGIGTYGKILCVTVASEAFIKNYPQEAARFLRTLRKASDWLEQNAEEGIAIGTLINSDSSLAEVRLSYESRVRVIDLDENNLKIPLQETIDFLYSHGFTRRKLTAEDLIDTSVYNNAGLN